MPTYKAQSIELVSHVFCPPGVDQYAQHLKWQWASLIHYPPPVTTTLSVCYTPQDTTTADQLASMIGHFNLGMVPETLLLNVVAMKPGHLFRRAIGRNWCAKRTKADVVHFCDADYLFGPGCLDCIAQNVGPESGLCMPGYMRLCTTHKIGDSLIQDARDMPLPKMDLEDATQYQDWQSNGTWSQRKQKLCIGGVQIVGGDLARKIGYLDGTSWVEPVSANEGFRSCRCDKVFRRLNKLSAKRLPCCVYRLRHSTDGRDFDVAGVKREKEVW